MMRSFLNNRRKVDFIEQKAHNNRYNYDPLLEGRRRKLGSPDIGFGVWSPGRFPSRPIPPGGGTATGKR